MAVVPSRLFEIQQKAFEPCFTGLDVVGRAKQLGAGMCPAFCRIFMPNSPPSQTVPSLTTGVLGLGGVMRLSCVIAQGL